MSRFAPGQPDLFSPFAPESTAPERPPLEQLSELLATLRPANRMPWPDLMTAMEAERHAYWLASQAGAEGDELVAAIMDETERLLYTAEQAGVDPFSEPPAA